jgi:hypothetical protein
MKAIRALLNRAFFELLWLLARIVVVLVILFKVFILSDVHNSLAQDPLDQWIAIGICWIIIGQIHKEDV